MILSLFATGALQAQEKQVLVYTFTGEGFVHKNIAASVAALEVLARDMHVDMEVTDDPAFFEGSLDQYDVIVFSNTNAEAFLNDRQRENFRRFIESGGGFMGIHGASTSEPGWEWYVEMLGGSFVRHPEYQSFEVKVMDPHHMSTAHLSDPWHWEDECYYHRNLNPGIHVLLAADLATVSDDPGKLQGESINGELPLAWCHTFGKSRVFYTALGHSIAHYGDPAFRQHLAGGLYWVME